MSLGQNFARNFRGDLEIIFIYAFLALKIYFLQSIFDSLTGVVAY
jgi:hypothetical protein